MCLRPISSVRLPLSARSLFHPPTVSSHDRVGDLAIARVSRAVGGFGAARLAAPARFDVGSRVPSEPSVMCLLLRLIGLRTVARDRCPLAPPTQGREPKKARSPVASGLLTSAPGEIRTPDLRFRSSPFAGILWRIRAVEGGLVQLAQVRIAELGTCLGTRRRSETGSARPPDVVHEASVHQAALSAHWREGAGVGDVPVRWAKRV